MKRKGMKLWMLLVVCILCVVGFSGNVCYSKETKNKTATEKQQFDIQAEFGFDNVARVGKSMLANVTVTNNGEDFSGLVQILLPVTYGNNVMYQSNLSIAAGETKQISMPMYLNNYTGKIVVNIADEKENIIAKKRVKVNLLIKGDKTDLIGILTDNKDVLGYWEEDQNKVFYLSEKNMPEQKAGLDTLDILVINDFDTQNLNKNQYKVLKNWVSKGGNLVIGTGVNASRTLGVFEDDFLTGSFAAADEEGKVKFNVEDASVYSDKKNDISMQMLEKDMGFVFVFSTDLGVDYANWKKKGAAFKNMVYDHIPNEKNTNSYQYRPDSYGLDLTDKGKLPSLKKYAVVLFIYVVVVSWVLYFILKKRDKLEWTWGFVPLFALVFAMVVYGMGASTRITAPFITYTRVIEWTGEDDQSGSGTTRMAITSPYNEKYSVAVPKGITAYAGMGDTDYYEESETNLKDYKIGFRQSGDQQIITLNNLAAFESGTIRTDEVVSIKGSYEADISCDQYEFNGTFTNKTGRQIRNAVFMSDGRVYHLGTIEDGETVDISNKCKNAISLELDHYTTGLVYSDFADVFGITSKAYYDEGGTLEENRFASAASYYFGEKVNSIFTQPRVIGIMQSDGADEDMAQSWGMDCSGITVSVFPVDVNYTNKDNQTFVSDLVTYGNVGDGMDEEYRSMYDKELTVEYALKDNETLTGLYYLSAVNDGASGTGKKKTTICSDYTSLDGTISAYDYKEKKYVKIFDGDKEGKVTDVKRFVGEENKVLLKIKTKGVSDEYTVPVISATKEVK